MITSPYIRSKGWNFFKDAVKDDILSIIKSSQSVTFENGKYNFPDKRVSGLYAIFNNDELVYIGISVNIFSRLKAHRFKKTKAYILPISDPKFEGGNMPHSKSITYHIEQTLIGLFYPEHNYMFHDLDHKKIEKTFDFLGLNLRFESKKLAIYKGKRIDIFCSDINYKKEARNMFTSVINCKIWMAFYAKYLLGEGYIDKNSKFYKQYYNEKLLENACIINDSVRWFLFKLAFNHFQLTYNPSQN